MVCTVKIITCVWFELPEITIPNFLNILSEMHYSKIYSFTRLLTLGDFSSTQNAVTEMSNASAADIEKKLNMLW